MPSNEVATTEGGLREPVRFEEIQEFKQRLAAHPNEPVKEIPGVDPAEIWEAMRECEAGLLLTHEEMLERLRQRK